MATIKYSQQRESIKQYLAQTNEHPTADTIYTKIREIYPHISLGTVYRNLNLLVDQGEIIKLSCGDGSDHFDYKVEPHYHFLCKECGSIIDLELDHLDQINKLAANNFPGEIGGHTALFYGKCKNCIDK